MGYLEKLRLRTTTKEYNATLEQVLTSAYMKLDNKDIDNIDALVKRLGIIKGIGALGALELLMHIGWALNGYKYRK